MEEEVNKERGDIQLINLTDKQFKIALILFVVVGIVVCYFIWQTLALQAEYMEGLRQCNVSVICKQCLYPPLNGTVS